MPHGRPSAPPTTGTLLVIQQRRFLNWTAITIGGLVAVLLVLVATLIQAGSMIQVEHACLRSLANCHRLQHSSRALLSARRDFPTLAAEWQLAIQDFRDDFKRLSTMADDDRFDAQTVDEITELTQLWQSIDDTLETVPSIIAEIATGPLAVTIGDHGLEQTVNRLLNQTEASDFHLIRALQSRLSRFDHEIVSFGRRLQVLTTSTQQTAHRSASLSLMTGSLLIMVLLGTGAWLLLRLSRLNTNLRQETQTRRTVEANLRQREHDLHSILSSIDEGVITIDLHGQITWFNQAAAVLTGYARTRALGQAIGDVLPLSDASGNTITVDTQPHANRFIDLQLHCQDGRLRHIDMACTPIADHTDRTVGQVLVLIDIGDRLQIEQRAQHAMTMESIGQLAGGVAHDFNNMLTGILGSAELLAMQEDGNSRRQRQIDTIITAAQRAAGLTRQLLDYARRSTMQRGPVDLNSLIQESIQLLRRGIDPRISIDVDLQAHRPYCIGDSTQLQNAVINLAVNARDAMPDGGRLQISSEDVTLDGNQASPPLPAGSYCRIDVRDNGTGIPEEVMPRIFEPFFTTKDIGRGSGLGLPAVMGTVERHGGHVAIASSAQTGTVVTIHLPVGEPPAPTRTPSQELGDVTGLTILLVDDEDVVRSSTQAQLEEAGFTVITAVDGLDAVERFTRSPLGIDIALVDMVMPRMTGHACCLALRRIRSDLPVVLWSGYTAGQDLDDLLAERHTGFLRKPAGRNDLFEAIATVLHADQP